MTLIVIAVEHHALARVVELATERIQTSPEIERVIADDAALEHVRDELQAAALAL